eukprot:UN02974
MKRQSKSTFDPDELEGDEDHEFAMRTQQQCAEDTLSENKNQHNLDDKGNVSFFRKFKKKLTKITGLKRKKNEGEKDIDENDDEREIDPADLNEEQLEMYRQLQRKEERRRRK